jgi:predicted TIM-barrel fold metal-dependent hydrolase
MKYIDVLSGPALWASLLTLLPLLFGFAGCTQTPPAPQQAKTDTPGRFPDLMLQQYHPKSMMAAEYHVPQKSKFLSIDVHNHLGKAGDPDANPAAFIKEMDAAGVAQVVNLDGGWGDDLKATIEKFEKAYPGRFLTYARVDWKQIGVPDFGAKAAAQLAADVKAGAHGLKIAKENLGLAKDAEGKFIPVDDPRADPVWAMCAELKIPVEIHVGDPVAFFTPMDKDNERYEELQDHPDWLFYPGYPPLETILDQLTKVIAKHPKTTFIVAHMGCYAENLRWVAQQLDKYPNMYVDIDARISELGRQPYTSRKFLLNYQDRVMFGTDTPPNVESYRVYWQFLETEDEYFDVAKSHHYQGRWQVYGMFLPDAVLEKLYYRNAIKLIPGAGKGPGFEAKR